MQGVFGIGETELVLILVFAFMVFGPDKLPGMGRTLGRALRQFRNAQEGFTQVVQTEVIDPAAEAMSENPKRPNRNRAAEFEEDSDLEPADGERAAAPKRTETFAERKRRLASERKAAEEAAAAVAAEPAAAGTSDSDDDAAVADVAPSEPAAADAAPAPAPEPAAKPTAADLYAMRRPAAPAEPAAKPEPAESATPEADAAVAPAPEPEKEA